MTISSPMGNGCGTCIFIYSKKLLCFIKTFYNTVYNSLIVNYFRGGNGCFSARLTSIDERTNFRFKQGSFLIECRNFRREWKKIYSESPLQYHISIRFYYAKEYLTSGYYTVSEIAQKCGFDDVSYFVRFFKRQAGLTPGEYKKQILGFD